MNGNDDRDREIAALRGRISQLSAASLRISASLDLDTVLGEIAENARALTGARYCAIATIDKAGEPVDFVTSGFTADEHRAMAEWSDGPRLFEHFRDLEGPIRIADVPGHVRALGFSPDRLPLGDLPGHADAALRHSRRQLLSRREGRRRGLHRRGRRDPGAVRLPGRRRDRQRSHLPRRAPRAGRP